MTSVSMATFLNYMYMLRIHMYMYNSDVQMSSSVHYKALVTLSSNSFSGICNYVYRAII